MKIFQKGFNFNQDGPGNRLVYHLQGCNMRCIWCSNPEGMAQQGGKECNVEDLADECKRSRLMFFGGGGVTFTGGEASLQHEELLRLLQLLHADKIHTAIETNGTSPRLQDLLPYIDYLIMDFKHYDSDRLRQFTGVGNENIKKNFEAQCISGRQQHIRIPLIHGFNDDCPEGFAEYFSQFNTDNTVFEFLMYHEYGKEKWKEKYLVQDGFVTKEVVKKYQTVFQSFGLTVIHT